MATFDRNKIRAFRLHAIVQNIGTACYCSYLEKHAIAAKFPSLTALLIDANEKSKLLQKFQGKDHVYSPYDDVGNLKPKYPQSADIIALHKLHDHCDLLKQNSVPANLNDWWNGKNYQKVFDTILRSESCLVGQPGAACLVLYHVRNNLLPGAHKNEFSLDEETYSKALDVVVPALKILGDHLGKRERDDIDKRVSEAKYKDIGEKEYDEVASIYKRDLASNRPEKDLIEAVLARKDVQKRWERSLDIDNILAPLVAENLIDHDNAYEELKRIPTKSERRMALLRKLQTTLYTRDQLKALLEIIAINCKQSFIAELIKDEWKKETGSDL